MDVERSKSRRLGNRGAWGCWVGRGGDREVGKTYFVFQSAWAAFTFSWAVWRVKGGLWEVMLFMRFN